MSGTPPFTSLLSPGGPLDTHSFASPEPPKPETVERQYPPHSSGFCTTSGTYPTPVLWRYILALDSSVRWKSSYGFPLKRTGVTSAPNLTGSSELCERSTRR